MNNMRIFSIGKIENNEKMVCINLDEKYAKGLRGLDGYSHVQVLWWADGCDNESSRNVLKKSHIRMVLMRLEYLLYILRKGQTQ